MRRSVVAGHDLVERIDRPEVEVRLAAQLAPDLQHVPVECLEGELHPVEEGVERLRVSGEVRQGELRERRRVAILDAPEIGDLLHAAHSPRALRLTVFCDQLAGDGIDRKSHLGECTAADRQGDRGQENGS